MAIIKCPECGHHISDKAPTCPSCGVEIADKVTTCPDCGEVFFNDEPVCPHCHRANTVHPQAVTPMVPLASIDTPASKQADTTKQKASIQPPPKKKGNGVALFVSFIIALLVCGICFYMYKNAADKKEMDEYEFAMRSKDLTVLQSYLGTFKDAPQAHRDSINAHIQAIKQNDQDWTNALKSNSKAMLEEYLAKHPGSPHRAEATQKIDSLDWAQASGLNTIEAYQEYLAQHPSGDHYDQAEEGIKQLKTKEITEDERAMIAQLFRKFFVSINEKNEEELTSTVADELTLLDKEQATKADVVVLMKKMYKEGMSNLIWRLKKDYGITKREIGDGQYEYAVAFTANKEEQYTDETKDSNSQYRVNAKVNPDGKISELKMSKVVIFENLEA